MISQKRKFHFAFIFITIFTVLISLSGCLLTTGAPLARRVEPGKWTVEGSAGPTGFSDTGQITGITSYLYTGRALGKHFEIGILPYYYNITTGGIVENIESEVIALPLKWDPFSYNYPFHLTIYAAPSIFLGDIKGFLIYEGIGFSYNFSFPLELFASYSIPYYGFTLFTGNIGFRYKIMPSLALGANFMFASTLAAGLNITLTTILGK